MNRSFFTKQIIVSCTGLALLGAESAIANAVIRSAAGASPAELQTTLNQFQNDLGGVDNGESGGPFADGYRTVNWDGVPDELASPNLVPGDFFLNTSPRGILFEPSGGEFLVSADSSNPSMTPMLFGDVDPSYSSLFQPFSSERVFAVKGGTSVDVSFFIPSDPSMRAWVRGLGVVFGSVDSPTSSSMEFFDVGGVSLGEYFVPAGPQGGLSFLGVSFNADEQIGSVRIHSGNAPLGPGILDGGVVDLVVMDDFFFSEPVPEPSAWVLGVLGVAGLAACRRLRRRV